MSALLDTEAAQHLATRLEWPYLDFKAMSAGGTPDFVLLPYVESARRRAVLIRTAADQLLAVLADPFDQDTQTLIEHRAGSGTARVSTPVSTPLAYAVTAQAELDAYLARHEIGMRALDTIALADEDELTTHHITEEISLDRISATESDAVRLVDSTLYDALKAGASDIHLETQNRGLAVKYRIDGVLAMVQRISSPELAERTLSRVKVLASLDIAERRIPQDGRFRARVIGREVDFRVSVMPSVFGEDAVIRILDKRSLAADAEGLTLAGLGFEPAIIEGIERLAAQPYGMLLVTGPTGSGKTTTLYAVITQVNQGEDKIVTIEDPVEYQLAGVLQIPVNEKKGLTFARGLRSILRHDPDRIMVGEIRDPETAEIAIQAALTGHTVFTTVHANNVLDVIGRFLHMKVDPYNFVSALNGVMAQRLLRLSCVQCAEPVQPSPELLRRSRLASEALERYHFQRGRGCAHCRGTGYKGRRAIGELLFMNDTLRAAIAARAPAHELKQLALEAGAVPLRETALALVASGRTSLEEANRVTFVE